MIKYLFTLLLSATTFVSFAQNITTTELNSQDLRGVISNLFNIEMQKYDLSEYLDKRYEVSLYIDEYSRTANNCLTNKRVWTLSMGQNRRFIEDAEDRERRRGDSNFNYESGELTLIESLTLAARIDSDSTALLSLSFMPNRSGGSFPLPVIALEQSYMNRPQYGSRPYKFRNETKATNKIPLLLYGSYYYDEEAKIMRFCGEKEIDPELTAKIVENIPHFYVIGIILTDIDAQ